jgi:bile acid:Na+ symporter, BASS family
MKVVFWFLSVAAFLLAGSVQIIDAFAPTPQSLVGRRYLLSTSFQQQNNRQPSLVRFAWSEETTNAESFRSGEESARKTRNAKFAEAESRGKANMEQEAGRDSARSFQKLESDASKKRSLQFQSAEKSGKRVMAMEQVHKFARTFCNLFPVWTVLTAAVALKKPDIFLRIPTSTFSAQIGMLMLCMGITLKPSDFKRVVQRPRPVLLAFLGCYGLMPALATGIGKVLQLDPSLAVGLTLVACINGAQASNLCTYIGQGDLALSVLMTTMTTFGAVLFTPLMAQLLLGTVVPVNAAAITKSTIQVVLAPILFGMSFNAKFPEIVKKILPFSPVLGVIITCLLVGTSVAGCAAPILEAGFKLQLAGALLHGLGGACGYFLTKPFFEEKVARTLGIEFAMKSSAFGFLLATLHFSDFAVRVPSAVSIVWMALIGSSMAVASRFFPPKEEAKVKS